MRRDDWYQMFAFIGAFVVLGVSLAFGGQGEETFTDARKPTSPLSDEQLSRALFPPPPDGMRGLPVPGTKAAVALNVLFDFDSARILDQYHTDLNQLGRVLTQPQYRDYLIEIEGHTDSVGSPDYNVELSRQRASSIQRYLVRNFAISPERLIVKGYGESRPRVANDNEAGRRINRRVEVVNSWRK